MISITDFTIGSTLFKIQYPDIVFTDFNIQGKNNMYPYFENPTTEEIKQLGTNQGNFVGEGYKCMLLPQSDSEIDAATTGAYKIDSGVSYTYDEIVAIAAASPASGNTGHVELTYSNGLPSEHNIEKVEVQVNSDGKIKTLYTFNQA